MSYDVDTEPDDEVVLPVSRWRRLMMRVADRVTAERQATVDAVVSAPAPLQPIDLTDDASVTEVLELAERVGEVVLSSGTAVADTTNQVEFITATYGLAQCDIDVTYNSIRISAERGRSLPPASTMRVVQQRSLDFTRLAAVDRLTRRIRRELLAPGQAHEALDVITTAPHPYNRWVATFAWSLLAAAIAVLLGGGALVAAVSSLATACIYHTNIALNRRALPFFFQNAIGGAIATAPAILLATFARSIETNPSLVIAAGITVLLSGLQLVGAVEDAITGAPITASARLLEVLMTTGGIIGGIVFALRVGQFLHAKVPPIDMSTASTITGLPTQMIAGGIASMAFAWACYAEQRALAPAAAAGAAAALCTASVELLADFGPVAASGAAATVVGFAGGLLARRALTPPLVVAMAGITPLLPGLKVYRGLFALINDQQLLGLDQLFGAFTVGCALAAGVTLGEWLARYLRRPHIRWRFGRARALFRSGFQPEG